MNKTFERQLALKSLQHLNAVLSNNGAVPVTDKTIALDQVTDLVNRGVVSEKNALATQPNVTPAMATASIDAGTISKINENSVQVNNALLSANQAITTVKEINENVSRNLDKLNNDFNSLSRSLESKVNSIARPDESKVNAEIHKTVSALFDQFRKEVPVERLEKVAVAVGKFDLKTARDVFGSEYTHYVADEVTNIDFGDMLVGVWSDPNAPQLVEDYVFVPEHLHQALIALDGKLPDNIWLAGERGTGKTEFVTQLAARLQRRLFRVNFDEALERADFIGGNTIENSNVVWKEGIITQAIRHPGAIVLLDEIGFARAQSLAALHALCEHSPHRSITIAETGERIGVADHVVFFGADNSNGHGDHSGNFAGVREQNTAFLDRFSFTLRFQYLDAISEADLIVRRTGLSVDAAVLIVQFANVAREKARAGLLTQPPSLRQLFAWARSVKKGLPVQVAFRNAIINKFPADCEAELLGVFTSHINVNEFKQALGG